MLCRGNQGGVYGIWLHIELGGLSSVLSKKTESGGASMVICSGLEENKSSLHTKNASLNPTRSFCERQ